MQVSAPVKDAAGRSEDMAAQNLHYLAEKQGFKKMMFVVKFEIFYPMFVVSHSFHGKFSYRPIKPSTFPYPSKHCLS